MRRFAVAWVTCAIAMLGCGNGHDAGTGDGGFPRAGGGAVATAPTGTGGTPAATGTPPPGSGGTGAPTPPIAGASGNGAPDAGAMCFLHVAIECDGDEDCTGGQVCCGTFDSSAFTYTSVKCSDTCGGMTSYKLCHPGETCPGMGQACRHSQVIPHDFISVCAASANVPSGMTGKAIPGKIVCGSDRCSGGEKCCLPALVQDGGGMQAIRTALPAYCVTDASACDCGGSGVDAGADDAG